MPFSENIETIKVNDGIATVETYKKNQDIDLILMDIKMPGIDGYEATKEIRKINKDVIPKQVVLISKRLSYGNRVDKNIIGNSAS